MWPFKRYPPRAELAFTDSWDVREGVHEGKRILVRINKGIAPAVRHPDYRHQVGVATPLQSPDERGFPSPSEQEDLAQLEDRLADLLAGDRETIHVATITTGGMQEFVFYTADPDAAGAKLTALSERSKDREIQCIIQHDPKWRVYRRLA
jgi:hypothetical protein